MFNFIFRLSPLLAALLNGCGLATDGEPNFPYELEVKDQTLEVRGEIVVDRVRVDQPSLIVIHPVGLVGETVDFTKTLGVAPVSMGTERYKNVVLNRAINDGEKLYAFLYVDKNDDKAFDSKVDVLVRDTNTRTVNSSFVATVDAKTADVDVKLTADNSPAYHWNVVFPAGEAVAAGSGPNAAITLKRHLRYRILNADPENHPLQILNGSAVVLAEGNSTLPMANDPDVKWENNSAVVFTVSDSLAQQLDSYRCGIHHYMTGTISIVD